VVVDVIADHEPLRQLEVAMLIASRQPLIDAWITRDPFERRD
jgi:hypothetical protein